MKCNDYISPRSEAIQLAADKPILDGMVILRGSVAGVSATNNNPYDVY